jgi:hypothetical protein
MPAIVPTNGGVSITAGEKPVEKPFEKPMDKPVLVEAAVAAAGAAATVTAAEHPHMEPLALSMIERYMPEKRGFFRNGWLRRKA